MGVQGTAQWLLRAAESGTQSVQFTSAVSCDLSPAAGAQRSL